MKYNLTFDIPNTSGHTSGVPLDANGIKETLSSIDWKSAITQAESIFDAIDKQTNEVSIPYITIQNPKNKYELSFTFARNQKLESKVLTFLTLPKEVTVKQFFGLLNKKKIINDGATGLFEANQVFELADMFFNESYEDLSDKLKSNQD